MGLHRQQQRRGKATWTVYATNSAAPTSIYRSAAVDLNFSKSPVDGAIYYWSTTVAGVRRATVTDAAPVDFLTPAQIGKCVACHTVSRNGARVGADISGNTLGVYNVKDRSVVIDPAMGIAMAWTTFNPDNSRIVTASKGVLTLRTGDTGAVINTIPLAPKFGTMPDWSPDGRLVAFAYSAVNKDRGISGSSIATMEYNNGTWSNLKTIVQSRPATATASTTRRSRRTRSGLPTSRRPAATPTTTMRPSCSSCRLMAQARDRACAGQSHRQQRRPRRHRAACRHHANLGPPTKPGETMFVAFTSARAYATVYAAGKYKQMWVAGIDPNKLPARIPASRPSACPSRATPKTATVRSGPKTSSPRRPCLMAARRCASRTPASTALPPPLQPQLPAAAPAAARPTPARRRSVSPLLSPPAPLAPPAPSAPRNPTDSVAR